jgi:hypothetical protein
MLKQCVPSKRSLTFKGLHDVLSRKMELFSADLAYGLSIALLQLSLSYGMPEYTSDVTVCVISTCPHLTLVFNSPFSPADVCRCSRPETLVLTNPLHARTYVSCLAASPLPAAAKDYDKCSRDQATAGRCLAPQWRQGSRHSNGMQIMALVR